MQKGREWIGRVVICVDLNSFYPSCEELRDPTLKRKLHAVIMTDQKEDITKGVVSSCSYEARKHGVTSAMSLSRAQSLCPDLVLRPVDRGYYSKISHKVMSGLEEFADVLEQASIDEAFLDCTLKVGSNKPEDYGKKIKESIKDRCGLLCSVGVTSTKATAKIACDYLKPDGLTVVYPDSLAAFLEPLQVSRVAGIGPKTQEALRRLRIETLGHLATADYQKLIEQFGKNGYWMWNVANGKDNELVVPREDHISLSTEYTLGNFTRDKIKVGTFLNELVDEIYQRAKKQEYLFKTIGVKIVRTDFTIESRETTFQYFQNSKEIISGVIENLVDKFAFTHDKPAIRKVGLKISHLIRETEIRKNAVQKTLLDYLY